MGAVVTVRGTVRNAAGEGVAGGLVTIRLITSLDGSRPPAFLGGGVTVIASVHPAVEPDGDWSVALVSNADPGLVPAGTYYEVIQQAPREPSRGFAIEVPLSGGPYDVDALVIIPPTSIPAGGLSATHLSASPAHAASAVSVLDVAGKFTATNVEGVLAEIGVTSFSWTSPSPLAVWGPITHGLGFRPQWLVVDTAGDLWEATATLWTPTQITLDFGGVAVNGTVYLS